MYSFSSLTKKLGNSRISFAAASRGDNPPGTRRARYMKRKRRAIAKASRKRNRT